MNINACRVCGFISSDPPWGEQGDTPLFEYCPCCGVEYGYQDSSYEGTKQYRKEWLSKGVPWDEPRMKPDNWDLEEQLSNVLYGPDLRVALGIRHSPSVDKEE